MKISFQSVIIQLLMLAILPFTAICQTIDLKWHPSSSPAKMIHIYQLQADSLFSEKQKVSIAELKWEEQSSLKPGIVYADSTLKKTSIFAEEANAIVALNGGFFDVEKGGSVAYLEAEGKVISTSRHAKEKWGKSDSLLNGAIILDRRGSLKLEIAKSSAYYELSDNEKAVMVTGPILLLAGKSLPLENSAFVKSRHPRSCLCETASKSILFIAIDGRSEIASGMNLQEVQKFLLRLDCRNAINLDGGGSTTLWVNNGQQKQIVNHPSDRSGERPVANILVIKEEVKK